MPLFLGVSKPGAQKHRYCTCDHASDINNSVSYHLAYRYVEDPLITRLPEWILYRILYKSWSSTTTGVSTFLSRHIAIIAQQEITSSLFGSSTCQFCEEHVRSAMDFQPHTSDPPTQQDQLIAIGFLLSECVIYRSPATTR